MVVGFRFRTIFCTRTFLAVLPLFILTFPQSATPSGFLALAAPLVAPKELSGRVTDGCGVDVGQMPPAFRLLGRGVL
jgi:hypothetical protein